MQYAPASEESSLPLEAVEFLCEKDSCKIASDIVPLLKNPLKLSEILSKEFSAIQRRALMHYAGILPKIREKFCLPEGLSLVCDRLAFEQATAKDISMYKAGLWPGGASVADLCCGMGGDSLWLPPGISARGADIAAERVLMFCENMERMGLAHRAEQRDALDDAGGDFFCIDPARRGGLSPSLENILELSGRFGGGMAKLPPAYPEGELPGGTDVMYLGGAGDCRECLLLLGSLGKGMMRAAAAHGAGFIEWQCERKELQSIRLEAKAPGRFILEPCAVLVRSHLFLSEARKLGLWQIDSTLAYLSCDSLPRECAGFGAYEIIGQSSLSSGEVKRLLRKHDAGRITLKKRGVEVVPEEEIRRLAPKGSRELVLFYARVLGEKRAILCEGAIKDISQK